MYCETIKELGRTVQNKRRGMLTPGVLLLHDVYLRSAASISALLEHFNWELFVHPPDCPDLLRATTTS
jgi:hypothetical protein